MIQVLIGCDFFFLVAIIKNYQAGCIGIIVRIANLPKRVKSAVEFRNMRANHDISPFF